MRPSWLPGFLLAMCVLGLLIAHGELRAAERDDELVAQLRQQIAALEKAPAEPSGILGFDSQHVQRRLAVLQQELAVLERRQQLEAQERNLRQSMNAEPRVLLRERLQTLAPDNTATEARLRELSSRRVQATTDREALVHQEAELRRAGTATPAAVAALAELAERIITKDEELRAIALRTEATENEGDLVRFGQALRDRLRAATGAIARPTLRALFAERTEAADDNKLATQLGARIANLDATLHNGQAGLDLQRQKLAGFDEEIRLFEVRPAQQPRRSPAMEQMLATDRIQQRMLGERLPILNEQVDALRRSRDMLQAQLDLLGLAAKVRDDDFAAMRGAYLERLRAPALAVAAVLAVYLLLSRIVFPLRYKKEELFLARRLGRYATIFLAVLIITFTSIDDLRLLATTLGVASAGLVIALQDVATSVFGWCVIMMGRKFTIGDRLEIDGARGDVLDIQILRTTLVELNNWLGVDQPTGRVFIVPNNFVFKSKVFNYSHGHPYVWGVVDVTVTYSTPVASALALFQKVLEEETREAFTEARTAAAVMQRRYGVEDAEYQPKVYTRIADCGVTFSLLYVCHYRQTPMMRNRINRRLIAELETHGHIRLAYPTRQVINTVESDAPTAVLGPDTTRVPFPPPRFEARPM
jgi:small-conductance mechanosensitive channel